MNMSASTFDVTDLDISNLLNDGLFEYSSSEESSVSSPQKRSPASSRDTADDDDKHVPYLAKLYTMLDECPPSVASWTRNGTAFAIYDSESLEKVIIPQYFQPIKFESFVRQLNSYRFKKSKAVVNDRTVLEFQHANFVKGRPDMLDSIKRRRRIRRKGPKSINEMNDTELRAAMTDLVKFVQTLHAELLETKDLARALAESRSRKEN
ncbi:hypothetical protein Ae201684P_001678 [Aphanomyces euteiches]|uniref:HSF-type DNA-binding domain-containing protein n=1 Tax=Aphanomyces euteiches TaxID=100861 RepID=A0A6G0X968_9STRA|nr:hypothetical protein Ae201684_007087 [Aphanomyces euteiches]KAH9052498.1 hypothetical protein Ae201684P_001678 [Aphanomyces euteiches]